MEVRSYLPSKQFAAMLGALLISSGLIMAATDRRAAVMQAPAALYAAQAGVPDLSTTNPNWQQAFAGDNVPAQMADIQNQANTLSSAVQGKNLTDSIAKSLTINTFALQGQGLADSADAQNQAVQQIISQEQNQKSPPVPAYTQKTLTLSSDLPADLRAWGNALPRTISAHPKASYDVALYPIADAVDNNSSNALPLLKPIAADYRALASAIIKLPTPPQLASLSVALANDYVLMAAACDDMAAVHDDPVRGMLGLQNFETYNTQNAQILYGMGAAIRNGGIVFTRAEPGAVWGTFIADVNSAVQQQASAVGTNTSGSAGSQTIFSP